LRRHRTLIAGSLALLCAHQATEAAVPVAIGIVIDRAVATGDAVAIVVSVVGLAALFTALSMAWRYGARLSYTAMERETHLLRVEVAERALDPRGLRGSRSGELIAVASGDAEAAGLVIRAAGVALAATTALLVAGAVLLTIHLPLGAGVLLGVPALALALQWLAPLLTRRSEAQQAALADTSGLATDLVGGLRVLRGIGAQDAASGRYVAASRQALAATLRAATMKGVHRGLTTAVNGLFLATIAGFAGWLALRGSLSVGELVAVVGLAQFIAEPVGTFGFCVQWYATSKASAGRIAAVLGAPTHLSPGTRTAGEPQPVRVRLEKVAYRSLDGLTLHARAGELLGVVAYDPRDAQALRALLAGQVPAADHEGTVHVDGVAYADLDLAAGRSVVLVEHHSAHLFDGTLRANLMPSATGDVAGALLAAAADDVVDAHPDGLDHTLTDGGSNLSGGQRQRIALARALVTDPPVLVLHDPTTAVDPVTEEAIAAGIARLRSARCTVLITSSPTLLSRATRVVVVDGGQAVAEGTHADLVDTDERYREAVLR
jgi:putative ABC transport system ATP-binding protein